MAIYRTTCGVFAAATLLAGSLAGCGSSAPAKTADPFELANAICAEYSVHRTTARKPRNILAPRAAELESVRAALRPLSNQPRVRVYASNLAALARLYLAVPTGQVEPLAGFLKVYQLDLKVYDESKALGLRACADFRPRKPIGG